MNTLTPQHWAILISASVLLATLVAWAAVRVWRWRRRKALRRFTLDGWLRVPTAARAARRRVFVAGTNGARHVWDGQQMWVRDSGTNRWSSHGATPDSLGGDEWTSDAREFILEQFDAFKLKETDRSQAQRIPTGGPVPECPHATKKQAEELANALCHQAGAIGDITRRLDALESKRDAERRRQG